MTQIQRNSVRITILRNQSTQYVPGRIGMAADAHGQTGCTDINTYAVYYLPGNLPCRIVNTGSPPAILSTDIVDADLPVLDTPRYRKERWGPV